MKVILLAPTPPPAGGIAGWTLRMKNASLKNEWEVVVVDEKVTGKREVFGDNNKRNFSDEVKRSIRIWRDLFKELNNQEVKVVHSNIPATTLGMLRELFCAIITKVKKNKFIIHYRCTLPNMVNTKISILVFRLLSNISDLVIVLNNPSKLFLEKYSPTKNLLIPNFIAKNDVSDKGLRKFNGPIKRILYVGGVIESKGCKDIIQVAKFFPDIEFRLVGKSDNYINELEKTKNVVLCGEKDKETVKQELDHADIFIFPSYFEGEGFSNALLEAMSSGLPCIVSDWAANRDMIEKQGGFVVSVKDVEAIKMSIDILIKDKDLRKKQSEWNIEKVKKEYVDDIILDKYVDAYESVIEI